MQGANGFALALTAAISRPALFSAALTRSAPALVRIALRVSRRREVSRGILMLGRGVSGKVTRAFQAVFVEDQGLESPCHILAASFWTIG